MFNSPPECPILAVAQQALDSAQALAHAMRKLRLSMMHCCACPARGQCPALSEFNAQLAIALEEIADEWSLK